MARKRPSLDSQLSKQADTTTVEQKSTQKSKRVDTQIDEQASKPTSTRAKARQGKKAISGFYDSAVSKQLRMMALEEDKTVQAMLGEALNLLFEKYGKDAIASEE